MEHVQNAEHYLSSLTKERDALRNEVENMTTTTTANKQQCS